MGFIRAALSAGLNSFNDSKFKEAIVLPDNVSGDALAIKGQLLTKDPDGRSRHSNQNTGLLSDGSVVIVPQGYTAVLVNNGTFLGEVLEAGSHEWQAGDNAWLLEKGGLKALGKTLKTVSLSVDKSSPNRKLSLSACNLLQVISSAHKTRSNTSANVTNSCLISVSMACLM